MLLIVNFHYIRDNFDYPYPAIFGKTPNQFRDQLEKLALIGNFVSTSDILASIQKGEELPQRSIMVTFDDGLKEQLEFAQPILNEMGIPACFFINTKTLDQKELMNVHLIHLVRSLLAPEIILKEILQDVHYKALSDSEKTMHRSLGVTHYRYDKEENAFLKYILNFVLKPTTILSIFRRLFLENLGLDMEKIHQKLYLNDEEIQRLNQIHEIGSHSHDHLPLGNLEDKEARRLIELSRNKLLSLGIIPRAFSYPYGSKEAIGNSYQWLSQFGFNFALTMERGINIDFKNPLLLKRCDNNDVPGGKYYNQALIKDFVGYE